MGAITGALGLGGGAGGTSFGGPSMASQQGNNNMQAVFNQLQQVASGQGPNPAQAQYNANIQNLAKQQAGAINSVQGISPALAARMASQQGSGAMQNAAAQGQANMANQQLGAMGAMGNIGGMQQGAANQMMSNINNANAGLAQSTMQQQSGMLGGLMGGVGAGLMMAAEGGDVDNPVSSYSAPGVEVTGSAPQQQNNQQAQTRSLLSQFLSGQSNAPVIGNSGPMALQKGMTMLGAGIGSQFNVPKPPALQPAAAPGLGFAKGGQAKDFRSGGHVKANSPQQKAVKKGNSYANDKIPAVLSEGEVVIPRSVMQSRDPVRASADFVANVMAKRRNRK